MQMRDYQSECFEKLKQDMACFKMVAAVLPTGAGKSLIETAIIDHEIEKLKFNECVLVLCHIRDVTVQLYRTYIEQSKNANGAFLWHGNKRPFISSNVLFGTMQGCSRSSRRLSGPMAKKVRVILIDEAHYFGVKSYAKICQEFYPDAKIVGFSATPFRDNQYSFSTFDKVSYALDSKTLIDQGYLCPPKLLQMSFPDEDFPTRLATCVKLWLENEKPRNLLTVIYLPTIEMAMEARNVFGEVGARTAFIEAKTKEADTAKIYRHCRDGLIDVICNVNKISVGIDIPSIAAVMMPYPTKSVVQYLQRIGRALRLHPGKKEAHVYVFSDAPSIKKGEWQKIHDYALGVKCDPTTPGEKLVNELEYLMLDEITNRDRIAWTRDAIRAVDILDRGGLPDVANLVAHKQFPQKYSKVIDKILRSIETGTQRESGGITDVQKRLLSDRFKFQEKHVSDMSKGDASALIAGLMKYHSRSPFTIPHGPMAGKHCSEVPGLYKKNVRDPVISKILMSWYRAGRPKSED